MGYLHRRGVFTESGWQQFTLRHPELLLPTGDAFGTRQCICTWHADLFGLDDRQILQSILVAMSVMLAQQHMLPFMMF